MSLHFFAGIDELMKGVGRDATKIFDDVHAWVNYDQLLAKCFIGPLRNTLTLDITNNASGSKSRNLFATSLTPNSGGFKAPFLPLINALDKSPLKQNVITEVVLPNEIVPRFDWIQKTNELTLVFYTKSLCNPGLVLRCAGPHIQTKLDISIQIEQVLHIFNFQLAQNCDWPPHSAVVNNETGKIEIILRKSVPTLWSNFGLLNRRKLNDLTHCNYLYDVCDRIQISHDSYALVLKAKQSILQIFPIGYHISVTATIEGTIQFYHHHCIFLI